MRYHPIIVHTPPTGGLLLLPLPPPPPPPMTRRGRPSQAPVHSKNRSDVVPSMYTRTKVMNQRIEFVLWWR